MITLNLAVFDEKNGELMLRAILHECRHALQHRLVEACDMLPAEYQKLHTFREVPMYKSEFQSQYGIQSKLDITLDDIVEYSTTFTETDARLYSLFSEKEYFYKIEKHIQKRNNSNNI